MLKKLKDLIVKANETGLPLPFARDAVVGKPSVSLLFAYIAFLGALIANIYLCIKDIQTGTFTFITFWVLASVLYLIRRLKTFKADIDDGSIELVGDDEEGKQ